MAFIEQRYATRRGRMYHGKIEDFLSSEAGLALRGKVQLIFTSPPYPLNTKKKYGNLKGQEYVDWIAGLAPKLTRLLKKDGSIVIEVGNSWTKGIPTMSTLALEALLQFKKSGGLHLCQQFISYNPARLPGPAQWVNVDRVRVKDSFTHVWWMSPSPKPQADNRRVLKEYSSAMKDLLRRRKYNAGKRPSEHHIREGTFFKDNNGAIPSNVLTFSNTTSGDRYLEYCREHDFRPHPARMPVGLAEFFIQFLSVKKNLVLDPFGGSNVTGSVAETMKRRWISVEANENYIESSQGRFRSEDLEVGG